mmetsp:Transcript_10590/g.27221  ORF Transcript_10590/g.27221 Transcript_10590/m.27221 type:complete len:367 (+) Transcript_10590:71-1171(+)
MARRAYMTPDELVKMEAVFKEFDSNGDGQITATELKQVLDEVDFTLTYNRDRNRDIQILMRQADVNHDQMISWAEFKDACLNDTSVWGIQNYEFRGLIGVVARFHEKDPGGLEYLSTYKFWPPPVFMIIVSIVELAVFLHYSEKECDSKATVNECPQSFTTPLAYRFCCRDQAWRFFTYMFVHAGWAHIAFNVLIQLLFGVFLEIFHGPFIMFCLYFACGIAGALASSVCDPATNIVGASGAVYGVIGAWVAHMVQNWDTASSPLREIASAFLFILTAVDFGNSVYQRYGKGETGVSYAAHVGGFLMGVTFGVYLLKNAKRTWYETYIKWFGVSTAITGVIFAIMWNIFDDPDENNTCGALAQCNE